MSIEDHPTVMWYRETGSLTPHAKVKEALDAETLKKRVLDAGAHDVGIVEIDSPSLSDEKPDILKIFPQTKALVSIVCRLNRENIRCQNRAVSDLEYSQTFNEINRLARKIVAELSNLGVGALNHSSGFPMDLSQWPGRMWPVSHKTIAVAAGLGHMGHNRLVIHPKFGNFVILDTILIDRPVNTYDQPMGYNPCIGCKLCVAVCPVGAIASDGYFNFSNCMTHNYRDRMGGFLDWTESVIGSKTVREYRRRVSDSETVSMWQSLSYGICNKSSYCMAVCPAGEDGIGQYLSDRKGFIQQVVKPFQDKKEIVYVISGSDAETHVSRKFPHKQIKKVSNGLRPKSAKSFLESMALVFQRGQSKDLKATYHFTFTGAEAFTGTVVIRDRTLEVKDGHAGEADLQIIADAKTWVDFLAKEKNLVWALVKRKIRFKGSPGLMKDFARCFPS